MKSYVAYVCSGNIQDIREIVVWAKSIIDAENLVIFAAVTEYFRKKKLTPTNTYTRILQERGKNRSEFILSIHNDINDVQDCRIYQIKMRRSKGIDLYSEMSHS